MVVHENIEIAAYCVLLGVTIVGLIEWYNNQEWKEILKYRRMVVVIVGALLTFFSLYIVATTGEFRLVNFLLFLCPLFLRGVPKFLDNRA